MQTHLIVIANRLLGIQQIECLIGLGNGLKEPKPALALHGDIERLQAAGTGKPGTGLHRDAQAVFSIELHRNRQRHDQSDFGLCQTGKRLGRKDARDRTARGKIFLQSLTGHWPEKIQFCLGGGRRRRGSLHGCDHSDMFTPTQSPFLPGSPRLILASTSRYRQLLLSRLGLAFSTQAPGVDEAAQAAEPPQALAERLAKEKALAVARQHPGAVVIGSDQVAVCDGRILGKPGTPEKALAQLLWQAGKSTDFHTAICLGRLNQQGGSQISTRTVTTRVVWRSADELTSDRLAQYVARENPVDCAGAAKSEGLGITLIQAFEGPDPTALVGLPLIALTEMLSAWGLDPLSRPGSPLESAQ